MNQHTPTADSDPSNTRPPGCVLILSNKIDNNRKIHEEYAKEMRQLWGDEMGCHLFRDRIHLDLSKNQINQTFEDLSNMEGASQYDYLVIVVNATGSLISDKNLRWANRCGGIFYRPINWLYKRFNLGLEFSPCIMGSDRKWYSESNMLASFFNDNDKWKGKPKVFILNYCRFAKMSDGYGEDDSLRRISKGKYQMSFFSRGTESDTRYRIPTVSDFTLVSGSSSRLVSEIKKVFSDQWKYRSLSQMLTTVNGQMRNNQCWSVFESSQVSTFMLNANGTPNEAAQVENPSVDDVVDQTIARLVDEEAQGSAFLPIDCIPSLVKKIIPKIKQQAARHVRRSETTLSKGCVLLISNALCDGDPSYKYDQTTMKNLWVEESRLCDLFDGTSYLNKSGAEMRKICDRFSSMPNNAYEYAVIIISSHGDIKTIRSGSDQIRRPIILGHKEGFLCERELLNLFNRSESTWRNKVKIFILDYCRGRLKDNGIAKASPFELQQNHVEYEYNSNELPPRISTVVDDSIIVYATQSSYVAYSYGLIAALSAVFSRYCPTKSILEMLTMVNARMKQKSANIAMSLFQSTLTEDYNLRPMAADIQDE